MKITFQNSPEQIKDQYKNQQLSSQSAQKAQEAQKGRAYQGAFKIGIGEGDNGMIAGLEGMGSAYGGVDGMAQLQQMAGAVNGKVQQDYMTVMANTLSDEDYGRMIKEGFSPNDMDPGETVTILDRIKAELAKSGTRIAGYNDDLDMETLEAALGSKSLAEAVGKSLAEGGIPLNEELASDIREAWEMTSSLERLSDGELEYMIRDQLSPQIRSLYMAENSGAGEGKHGSAMYYQAGVQGYYAQAGRANVSWDMDEKFREQVDDVIRSAGLEADEEGRNRADWLLKQNLPLTAENLKLHKELTEVSFPIKEEKFGIAVRDAIMMGDRPQNANLAGISEETIYEKANRIAAQYERAEITDRRMLEEVRLHMTSEVNVKLLRSGFAIDTAPMEELVEALKAAERQVAEEYFPKAQDSVEKYHTYRNVNQIMQELPGMPARLLGVVGTDSLDEVYRTGQEMQREYENAREKYETLMTAPRADLGDSIRKAFANVDEILTDLGVEINEESRKAVRVLGYNRMELNLQNIDRVREAQRTVTGVIQKMTPAAVLGMIRDDVNPLEKSFEELEAYFESRPERYEESSEDYARFLYRLERDKAITPTERESYIGIYRMLHQIEKKDGQAVGMILNTGAQLQFGNLLSAARTANFGSLDVSLADGEAYRSLIQGEDAIDRQIEKAYAKMEREAMQEAGRTTNEAAELLEKAGFTLTVNALLASEALLSDPKAPFDILGDRKEKASDTQETADGQEMLGSDEAQELWELMEEEDFPKLYREEISRLDETISRMTFETDSFIDVRQLRMASRQLGIAAGLHDQGMQEFFMPLELEGEMGKLHLTLEQGKEDGAAVSIEVNAFGKMTRAEFQVRNGRITGTLWGEGDDEVMKLSEAADILGTNLQRQSSLRMEEKPLIIDRARVNKGKTSTGSSVKQKREQEKVEEVSSSELFQIAKMWIKAVTQKEVEYEN